MLNIRLAMTIAAFAMIALPVHSETLTNDSIIALSKAGLGSEAIIAKIKASANRFDLSTESLVSLKRENVPDPVIAAMLNGTANTGVSGGAASDSDSPDPRAQHASGIYILEDASAPAKMQRMDATTSNQTKTTGILASAFSYGLAKINIVTVLPNVTARIKATSSRPIFYFYFSSPNSILSGSGFGGLGGMQLPGTATSPNEFSLVRFDTHKGDREVVLGQMNIVGIKGGVMDKARVSFSYSDVSPGVFKVTPDNDLPPGEYGFIYSSSTGI